MYIEKKLSLRGIANIFHVDKETIRKRLLEFGIKRRNFIHKPTSIERKFMKIIDKHNLPFKYVGNGNFLIGRYNPDFIETNKQNVCIEIFGNYWHTNTPKKQIKYSSTYEGRKEIFDNLGWKCIIFWEDELNNENLVLNRLREIENLVSKDNITTL